MYKNHERKLLHPDDDGSHGKGTEECVPDGLEYGFRHHAVKILLEEYGKDRRYHRQIWRSPRKRLFHVGFHVSRHGALEHKRHHRSAHCRATRCSRCIYKNRAVSEVHQEKEVLERPSQLNMIFPLKAW